MKLITPRFILLALLLVSFASNAQQKIILLQENFDANPCSGHTCEVGGYNGWNVGANTVGPLSNHWFVSINENGGATQASCGQRNPGSTNGTLHIGTTFVQDSFFVANGIPQYMPCTTGDCGDNFFGGMTSALEATYGVTGAFTTDIEAQSPSINCTAYGCPVYLTFNYINNARANNQLLLEQWFSGTNWTPLAVVPVSDTCASGDGLWSQMTVKLIYPNTANNPDVRIGFRWTNNEDSSGYNNSSAAIDSVVVYTFATPGIGITATSALCAPADTSIGPTTADPDFNYLWTINNGTPRASLTNADTVNVSFATPGTYPIYLTVSNATCTQTDTSNIVVNDCNQLKAAFTPGDTSICIGACISFVDSAVSSLPLQFVWTFNGGSITNSTAQNPPQVCFNTAGSFPIKLVVTDIFGKKDSATHTVTVNALPVLVTSNDTAICMGTSATLLASGATTYMWSPVTGLSDTSSSSVTASPGSNTTYTVTGTSNGCSSSKSIAVTLNPQPVLTTSPDTTICPGTNANLSVSGATTYTWAPAANLNSSTDATVTATPVAATTYTVTGTANGCSSSSQIIVTMNPVPTLTTSSDTTVCSGNSANLSVSGALTYSWAPSATLSSSTAAAVTATPSSSTTYTVTGTGANTCTSNKTVVVTISTPPVLNTSAGATICTGGNATLTASGATTYTWSPATGLNSTTGTPVTASPATSTTYTVTGIVAGGCSATGTVSVTVNVCAPVVADFSFDSLICENYCIQFTDKSTGNPVSWAWTFTGGSPDSSVQQNPGPICFATTNVYNITLKATGPGGNSDVITRQLTVIPGPQLTVTPDTTTINEESSVKLVASGGNSYKWSPNSNISSDTIPNPVVSPLDTTVYTVIATNPNGCTAQKKVLVNVIKKERIFAPNTFTPNSDGVNDFFKVYVFGNSPVTEYQFSVYDRWGAQIFFSNDLSGGWDGTIKGKSCPVGVYVWFYRVKFADSREIFTDKGSVTLMR